MNERLLYFILCILIGLTVTIPLILVFHPIFHNANNSYTIFYIGLFPLIFALVTLSIIIGINKKCLNS